MKRDRFVFEEVRPIHRRTGVLRALRHEWGISYDRMNRLLGFALAPFVIGEAFSRMPLAVARRPV